MAILVTGGAGFIGANFVLDWLTRRDELVINLDKLTYAGHPETLRALARDPGHVFVHGDICDQMLVDRLLAGYRPRAIVHFAAESHVDRSIDGPAAFVETNIVGTFRLLEAARSYWLTLDAGLQTDFRFLYVSTDEVFGSLAPGARPFVEGDPHAPNSPYSASKAAADHLVRAWFHTYGLPVLTTHCSNNYGPYQYPEKLIPLVILEAVSGRALPVYGDGLQVRDWLYVADHCAALQRVLEAGRPGDTYHIGGCCEVSNLKVVHTICALLDEYCPRADGSSHAQLIRHVADRPGHDRRYAINAGKLARELGWQPAETFETGLRKTVGWYLSHPDWIRDVTRGSVADGLVSECRRSACLRREAGINVNRIV